MPLKKENVQRPLHVTESTMQFGQYVREQRLAQGYSLRRFCETAGLDPSNWSKIERGLFPAPGRETLEHLATVLKLKEASDEWYMFFDLAAIAQKKIPEDIYADKEVMAALPIFFRKVRGDKPKKEDLKKLFDLLKHR